MKHMNETAILKKLHTVGIEELTKINSLNKFSGDYINLECKLPNGKTDRILDDSKVYLANQIDKINSDRCYGIAADENQIAIYEYGCEGRDAELIMWIKL